LGFEHLLVLRDPRGLGGEPARAERAGSHASELLRPHETGVLEQAGLVTTEKVGRVRTCTLGPRRLEQEAAWIERCRQLWVARFDALDTVVEELKRKEKVDGRRKRK
jgi:DNA-binding transcriptional ArsR family regulator